MRSDQIKGMQFDMQQKYFEMAKNYEIEKQNIEEGLQIIQDSPIHDPRGE